MYKEYGFFERLSKIEEEFPGANIILHKYGVLPQVSRYLHITFTLNLSMNECSSSFTDLQIVFGYQIFDNKIDCRVICRDEFSIVISMV